DSGSGLSLAAASRLGSGCAAGLHRAGLPGDATNAGRGETIDARSQSDPGAASAELAGLASTGRAKAATAFRRQSQPDSAAAAGQSDGESTGSSCEPLGCEPKAARTLKLIFHEPKFRQEEPTLTPALSHPMGEGESSAVFLAVGRWCAVHGADAPPMLEFERT